MEFDIKNCIRSNDGKIYCWDSNIHKYVEVTIRPVEANKVPNDVLEAYARKAVGDEK